MRPSIPNRFGPSSRGATLPGEASRAKIKRSISAFTFVEVMMASTVMVLAIASSIIVLQQGMRALDTARFTTLAGQILQSQMEKLRLLTWTQLTNATSGPVAYSTFTPDVASTASTQMNRFMVGTDTNRCSQVIEAAPGVLTSKMMKITLTANWRGLDGSPHTLSYVTYYGQNGLSDFFYTTN